MARFQAERMVARLGNDWYGGQLQLFGFGLKTTIELPAESAGVLPTPGKLHPNGAYEWSTPTPFSLAMGHNIQVTTLQMLRALCDFSQRRLSGEAYSCQMHHEKGSGRKSPTPFG